MFTTLHTLAQSSILHLAIVAEGSLLRVTLQPSAVGNGALPALSLLATPEEFDRDFAAAVQAWSAPTTPLLEQAAAATAGKGKADAKALPAPKAAPKPAPDAAKAGKVAKGKPAKPALDKPTEGEAEATIAQDRLACIADMRAYLAGNAASDKPVKPSRADYLGKYKPTTGRRYERLFASFDELVAAAQQQALPEVGEPAPHAEAPPPGEPHQTSGTDANSAAPEPAVVASAPDTAVPQHAWPLASTTDDGKPAHVALKDLQAPPADATDTLFKGASGFSLDLI